MPNYPSQSLADRFISESFQDILQIYNGDLVLDGTGTVLFNIADIGGGGLSLSAFATTGSNTFIGTQTVTGSLLSSGSNALLGNTILSGTLNVQGQYPVTDGSASVSIIGNTDLNGYLRFDPVSTNINTQLTASYIYVSGSTQDLYFSQNGNGFSNVTRLRWLEGNLYTGLLHGGLITSTSATTYKISSGSGIIVNLNASVSSDPYPTIQFLQWLDLTGSITALSASYEQQFVGINAAMQIITQGTPFYDGQRETLIPIGVVLHNNHSIINAVKTSPAVAYGSHQRTDIFTRAFGSLKLSGYALLISGSSTGSLVVGAGTAYADGHNYADDPNNPSYITDSGTSISKIFRYRQSGSADWAYDTNGGIGHTSIDPTQYSNNGVLTAVPGTGINRRWTVQRVYWYPNTVSRAIIVYYGNTTYVTELDAIANVNNEPFVEAPNTATNAIYLGAIIVRNDANFTDATTYKIILGGLFRNVGGSGGGSTITQPKLSALSDVVITSPTDGQPLVYNSTNTQWINSSSIHATASVAVTSSYAINALTASYAMNGGGSGISASYATTSSYANVSKFNPEHTWKYPYYNQDIISAYPWYQGVGVGFTDNTAQLLIAPASPATVQAGFSCRIRFFMDDTAGNYKYPYFIGIARSQSNTGWNFLISGSLTGSITRMGLVVPHLGTQWLLQSVSASTAVHVALNATDFPTFASDDIELSLWSITGIDSVNYRVTNFTQDKSVSGSFTTNLPIIPSNDSYGHRAVVAGGVPNGFGNIEETTTSVLVKYAIIGSGIVGVRLE
jgi:hypothetical protein